MKLADNIQERPYQLFLNQIKYEASGKSEAEIATLANCMKNLGCNPMLPVVRPITDELYEVITHAEVVEAAKLAGLDEIWGFVTTQQPSEIIEHCELIANLTPDGSDIIQKATRQAIDAALNALQKRYGDKDFSDVSPAKYGSGWTSSRNARNANQKKTAEKVLMDVQLAYVNAAGKLSESYYDSFASCPIGYLSLLGKVESEKLGLHHTGYFFMSPTQKTAVQTAILGKIKSQAIIKKFDRELANAFAAGVTSLMEQVGQSVNQASPPNSSAAVQPTTQQPSVIIEHCELLTNPTPDGSSSEPIAKEVTPAATSNGGITQANYANKLHEAERIAEYQATKDTILIKIRELNRIIKANKMGGNKLIKATLDKLQWQGRLNSINDDLAWAKQAKRELKQLEKQAKTKQEVAPTIEITTQGEITESDVNFTDGEWDTTPTPAPRKVITLKRLPSKANLVQKAIRGWNCKALTDDELTESILYNLSANLLQRHYSIRDKISTYRFKWNQPSISEAAKPELFSKMDAELKRRGVADRYEFDVNILELINRKLAKDAAKAIATKPTVETVEITTQGEITESDVNFTDGGWDTTPGEEYETELDEWDEIFNQVLLESTAEFLRQEGRLTEAAEVIAKLPKKHVQKPPFELLQEKRPKPKPKYRVTKKVNATVPLFDLPNPTAAELRKLNQPVRLNLKPAPLFRKEEV